MPTVIGALFSAYAEVFLGIYTLSTAPTAFLCLRRGVSMRNASQTSGKTFSLPTQRCFLQDWIHRDYQELFSAYAEVFPAPTTLMSAWPPFLCLRRGVFISKMITISSNALFSAYAEMFPLEGTTKHLYFACLCLRRGVSVIVIEIISSCYFSLPTQRCFPVKPGPDSLKVAFLCLRRGVSSTS